MDRSGSLVPQTLQLFSLLSYIPSAMPARKKPENQREYKVGDEFLVFPVWWSYG